MERTVSGISKEQNGAEETVSQEPSRPAWPSIEDERPFPMLSAETAKLVDKILEHKGLRPRRHWERLPTDAHEDHTDDQFQDRHREWSRLEALSARQLAEELKRATEDRARYAKIMHRMISKAEAVRLASATYWSSLDAVGAICDIGPRNVLGRRRPRWFVGLDIIEWSELFVGLMPKADHVVDVANRIDDAIRHGVLSHDLARTKVVLWARGEGWDIRPDVAGDLDGKGLSKAQLRSRLDVLEKKVARQAQVIADQANEIRLRKLLDTEKALGVIAVLARDDEGRKDPFHPSVNLEATVNLLRIHGVEIARNTLQKYILEGQSQAGFRPDQCWLPKSRAKARQRAETSD